MQSPIIESPKWWRISCRCKHHYKSKIECWGLRYFFLLSAMKKVQICEYYDMVAVLELVLVCLACIAPTSSPLHDGNSKRGKWQGPVRRLPKSHSAAQHPMYQGSGKSASQLFVRNQIFKQHTFSQTTRIWCDNKFRAKYFGIMELKLCWALLLGNLNRVWLSRNFHKQFQPPPGLSSIWRDISPNNFASGKIDSATRAFCSCWFERQSGAQREREPSVQSNCGDTSPGMESAQFDQVQVSQFAGRRTLVCVRYICLALRFCSITVGLWHADCAGSNFGTAHQHWDCPIEPPTVTILTLQLCAGHVDGTRSNFGT